MKSKLLLSVAVLLATVLPATAAPLTLSVLPASAIHELGDVFSVDISVSNAVDLISYQFNLEFDPMFVRATGVTWGPYLETGGSTITSIGAIDNTAGLIDSIADVLIAGSVSGSGVLASISFEAIGVGMTNLNLTNPLFFDVNFVGLTPTLNSGIVSVNPAPAVPEPPTVLLLLMPMIAFSFWRCVAVWSSRRAAADVSRT